MDAERASEPMLAAVRGFLDKLDEAQRRRALRPFEGPERQDWSYLPGRRPGLRLEEMSAPQREAAFGLMRSALSPDGSVKASSVIELEPILGEIEGNPARRDPGLYTFTIFGAPSSEAAWGWRLEGHHLSLNFTSATGRVVAVTPAFFGANPAKVPHGPRAGWRVLAAEEDLARELLGTLDRAQQDLAVLAVRAPRDIITGTQRKASLERFEGLAAARMGPAQRELLLRLLEVYVQNLRPDLAREQIEKIRNAGIELLHFAWAGDLRRGEGHYYRIHGPATLIEYDNTQNNANHVHSVWRDLTNDFGEDELRRHYEQGGHDPDEASRTP
jgi:hypothetical protein